MKIFPILDYSINLHPSQIFCNHQNPWKDVLDYVSRFVEDFCIGAPNTERNKISWLASMNQTIRIFSNYHSHAPNFFDGWQLQFVHFDLNQPHHLMIVAVDCDMIGHDLTELAGEKDEIS